MNKQNDVTTKEVEPSAHSEEKDETDFSEYEAWRGSGSLVFHRIGGCGMLLWATFLVIYELYYWMGGFPNLDYMTGMTLISFVMGLGATLTGITGLGFWRSYGYKAPLVGFILAIFFGWFTFASDLLDTIYGMNVFLWLWSLGYLLMGVLVIVWGVIMIIVEEISGNRTLAKYGGYALFFGGFAYLTYTNATYAMVLVLPGLIMTAIAVLTIR